MQLYHKSRPNYVDWQKYTISVSDVRWFALSELLGIGFIFLYSIAAYWVSMSELTENMSNYARDLTADIHSKYDLVDLIQCWFTDVLVDGLCSLHNIRGTVSLVGSSIDPSIQNNREEYFRLHNKRTIRGWNELMDQSKTLTKEFFDLMQNYLYNETFSIGLGTHIENYGNR